MALRTEPETWTIRVATDGDGPAIGRLFAAAQYPDYGVDWSALGIGKWWIVAERDGQVVGATQVILSKPFAYLGEIVIARDERSETAGEFGELAQRLFATAFAMVRASGADIVRGWVHSSRGGMGSLLERYGGHATPGTFLLYWKQLAWRD